MATAADIELGHFVHQPTAVETATGPSEEWLTNNPYVNDNPQAGSVNPLNKVTAEDAKNFRDKYGLPVEESVFVRGVIALRSQTFIKAQFVKIKKYREENPIPAKPPIRLTIGEHKYTPLETEILYKAFLPQSKWETLKGLSRLHWLLIVTCIYAAMTQGWDQAAMAGAAIQVMTDLGKPTSAGTPSDITRRGNGGPDVNIDHNTWLLGLTVGVPFFAGAILGLIITDPITRILHFGRRGAICVAAMFSFISVIGSASVQKWEHLLAFRILLGAGMAGKASIVPILLSETSPKDVRGFLLVFWQLFVAFGLAAGSIANLSVYRLDVHASWRYMFISACIPAFLLLSLILFSPESPRWLIKESGAVRGDPNDEEGNARRDSSDEESSAIRKLSSEIASCRKLLIRQAYKSLVDLRGESVPILAAGELFLMHTRLIDEQRRLEKALKGEPYTTSASIRATYDKSPFEEVIGHVSWRHRVTLMFFRSGYTQRAHRAAAAVMVSQQLCGINLIAFTADTFFRYSFFHQNKQTSPEQNVQLLGFSLGLMLLGFIAVLPALFVIDIPDGRRRVLNMSFPVMAFSLLGSALVLKTPGDSSHPSTGVIVGHYFFLVLFIIAYSVGEGPAAFVVSAEVFPLVNRELGMSLAVCWNFIGAGLLAVVAPWLLNELGQFGVLLLFAGTNLLAWFLCFWLVPSTGNEDLETVFEQLDITSRFMFKYTLKTISNKITKPVEYFLGGSSKSWGKCGYPKVDSPRTEWNKEQGSS